MSSSRALSRQARRRCDSAGRRQKARIDTGAMPRPATWPAVNVVQARRLRGAHLWRAAHSEGYLADRSRRSFAFTRIGKAVSCQPAAIPVILDQSAIHSRIDMTGSLADRTIHQRFRLMEVPSGLGRSEANTNSGRCSSVCYGALHWASRLRRPLLMPVCRGATTICRSSSLSADFGSCAGRVDCRTLRGSVRECPRVSTALPASLSLTPIDGAAQPRPFEIGRVAREHDLFRSPSITTTDK